MVKEIVCIIEGREGVALFGQGVCFWEEVVPAPVISYIEMQDSKNFVLVK